MFYEFISELPQEVSEEIVIPLKPEEQPISEDFAAPRFTTTLQKHVDVQEGTSITLTCVVTGKPVPEVTWFMVRVLVFSIITFRTVVCRAVALLCWF